MNKPWLPSRDPNSVFCGKTWRTCKHGSIRNRFLLHWSLISA